MYGQRLRSHVSLISHPYGDSSAPYLGTAILTILCAKNTNQSKTRTTYIAIAVSPGSDTDSNATSEQSISWSLAWYCTWKYSIIRFRLRNFLPRTIYQRSFGPRRRQIRSPGPCSRGCLWPIKSQLKVLQRSGIINSIIALIWR